MKERSPAYGKTAAIWGRDGQKARRWALGRRIVVGHKANGDPIFRHVYAKTQRELTEKLHQSIECYQDVELTEDSRMTLSEWLDCWLAEYKEGTIRPGTLEGYRNYIENYIKPQLGGKQVSLITTQDVQRMYRRLKNGGRVREDAEGSNGSPTRRCGTSTRCCTAR